MGIRKLPNINNASLKLPFNWRELGFTLRDHKGSEIILSTEPFSLDQELKLRKECPLPKDKLRTALKEISEPLLTRKASRKKQTFINPQLTAAILDNLLIIANNLKPEIKLALKKDLASSCNNKDFLFHFYSELNKEYEINKVERIEARVGNAFNAAIKQSPIEKEEMELTAKLKERLYMLQDLIIHLNKKEVKSLTEIKEVLGCRIEFFPNISNLK